MVDRGGCTFVQKVRNAQRVGAAGVMIADNTCLCSFQDVCHPDPGHDCEIREPIMADDGSGSDISIPSFFNVQAGCRFGQGGTYGESCGEDGDAVEFACPG